MKDKLKSSPIFRMAWIGIGVLVSFLVGDRIFSGTMFALAKRSTMPTMQLYGGRGQVDTVILGNSRGYRHFDENHFTESGGKAANYSLIGGGGKFVRILFEDYLRTYGSPELVIFEPSCLTMGDGQLVAHRWLRHESPRIEEALLAANPELFYAGKISHLVDCNSNAFLNTLAKVFQIYQQTFREEAMEPLSYPMEVGSKAYFRPTSEGLDEFRKIVSLSEKHGVELKVVISPVYPAFLDAQSDYSLESFVKDLESIAGAAAVLDGSRAIKDAAFFADPVHLNVAGKDEFHLWLQEQVDAKKTSK